MNFGTMNAKESTNDDDDDDWDNDGVWMTMMIFIALLEPGVNLILCQFLIFGVLQLVFGGR